MQVARCRTLVVLEVDVSVAVEIEGKSSVDEEQIIQKRNLKLSLHHKA